MKVKYETYFGRSEEVRLKHYVSDTLARTEHGEGHLESIGRINDRTVDAIARLIETLAEKGILTLPEIEMIVEGYHGRKLEAADCPPDNPSRRHIDPSPT